MLSEHRVFFNLNNNCLLYHAWAESDVFFEKSSNLPTCRVDTINILTYTMLRRFFESVGVF